MAITATLSNGARQTFRFDTEYPVLASTIEQRAVPLIPENMQTRGPYECYEVSTDMQLNKAKLLKRVGDQVPPPKSRRATGKMDIWRPYTPVIGGVIGFVGGYELTYSGTCKPHPGFDSAHIFTAAGRRFVPLTQLMGIFARGGPDGGAIMTRTPEYLRKRFNRAETSVTIRGQPKDEVFDTLILLKLLGAADINATHLTLVSVDTVDAMIAQCGTGSDKLDWSILGK